MRYPQSRRAARITKPSYSAFSINKGSSNERKTPRREGFFQTNEKKRKGKRSPKRRAATKGAMKRDRKFITSYAQQRENEQRRGYNSTGRDSLDPRNQSLHGDRYPRTRSRRANLYDSHDGPMDDQFMRAADSGRYRSRFLLSARLPNV